MDNFTTALYFIEKNKCISFNIVVIHKLRKDFFQILKNFISKESIKRMKQNPEYDSKNISHDLPISEFEKTCKTRF